MLKFKPKYVPKVWGARRFEDRFGRDMPEGPIGESWELVDFDHHATVVESGEHAGASLGELWRSGVLGGSAKGEFPFFLKWLDVSERMSAQVHPGEEFCVNTRCGKPKTEAWLVVEADPKATLLIGNYPGFSPQTLFQAIKGGSLEKWMYESVPRIGDIFLIKAGTIHSVGAGFLLLEVQQPSDVTFRLYDWDRTATNGESRELHVEEGAACIQYNEFNLPQPSRDKVVGPTFQMNILSMGSCAPADQLRVFVAHAGGLRLLAGEKEYTLNYGDVMVGETNDGPISVASGSCALISEFQYS